MFLDELCAISRRYNNELDLQHDACHVTSVEERHPSPAALPLSHAVLPEPREDLDAWVDQRHKRELAWINEFYGACAHVIERDNRRAGGDPTSSLYDALLARRSDMESSELEGLDPSPDDKRDRVARIKMRMDAARAVGLPEAHDALIGSDDERLEETAQIVAASFLTSTDDTPRRAPNLAQFVIRCLVESHLELHLAESYVSGPLASELERVQLVEQDTGFWSPASVVLQRSIELSTFVWAIARTAPWIFAEDEVERNHIRRFYGRAWRTNMPMRTMWISAQVSLLALHRRAFARQLQGDNSGSYRDFHKLQRTIRDTFRRIQKTSMHVDGAVEFLDELDALADFHIGELYQSDRDHTSALKHFQRAYARLNRLRGRRGKLVVANSRWFVELQLQLGNASYELGLHKASLAWYLRTWRSLVDLIAADTSGETTHEKIDWALEWLDRVVDEPELHKIDAEERLDPVIDQLEGYRVDPRFTALASRVLLRLGHLLFVLNLDDRRAGDPARFGSEDGKNSVDSERAERGRMAQKCMKRAYQLDPQSTLAASDLLKIDHRARLGSAARPEELERVMSQRQTPVWDQWPGGASASEAYSRAIEYVLLQQLHQSKSRADVETQLARELLYSLLLHTDSIEARRSQIHSFLTRPPTVSQPPDKDLPSIEFVCLRRYSSAYPILPRPQAFRADGGGYFLRVCPGGTEGKAFGIVVDPGTSYVECLYRSGFTVDDIDMIVVTHDHVDHASSFEPLLSLRHEMMSLRHDHKVLFVAGNKSVLSRWKQESDDIEFFPLDGEDSDELLRELSERITSLSQERSGAPRFKLELRSLSSEISGEGRGHNDLRRNPSIGVMFRMSIPGRRGADRTVVITSDLPGIDANVAWPQRWVEALSSDVLICHVSSVPMTELRKMASLNLPRVGAVRENIDWINNLYEREPLLARRFDYAHWLKSGRHGKAAKPVGATSGWVPPTGHPYLGGLLTLARAFKEHGSRSSSPRLFVIGELSEELGSFRGKIAVQVNRLLFDDTRCRAVTADVGLRVVATAGSVRKDSVRILCSTCELDNDLAPVERYHRPGEIVEICVKGENEGIFYNCLHHDPPGQVHDPTFVEKHERYDVFGR